MRADDVRHRAATPPAPDGPPVTERGPAPEGVDAPVRHLFAVLGTCRGALRREVREALVLAHTPFALSRVRRLAVPAPLREDARQVALLALIQAVDRFDPGRGVEFTTYAGPWVDGALRRFVREQSWPVHVPRPLAEATLAALAADGVPLPGPGLSAEARACAAARSSTALEPGGRGDHPSPGCPQDAVVERVALEQVLGQLPERDALALRLRFWDQASQAEAGAALGLSQPQVSRTLARAVRHAGELLNAQSA